jgi:hypothetical protein
LFQGGQDVRPGMHGLELAGGHHPNDLGRYRELIGMEGSGLPEHLARFHPNVMALLNIRYVLWPDAQLGELEGARPVSTVQLPDGRTLSSVHALETLPRARVVGEALVVPPGRTVETILDVEAYDPGRQVVLEEEPSPAPGGAGVTGEARWVERTNNRLVLDVEATGPALLVVADNWFPAWRASVNGEDVPLLRADHALRAISVPQGASRVEMWYDAPLLRAGLGISLLAILLLLGAAAAEQVVARRSAGS